MIKLHYSKFDAVQRNISATLIKKYYPLNTELIEKSRSIALALKLQFIQTQLLNLTWLPVVTIYSFFFQFYNYRELHLIQLMF